MSRHTSSSETSCSDHSPGKIGGHANSYQVSRSHEDQERKEQARKRKKWKQNLLVFTSEEDLSSESDVQNETISIFENNEALALRYPYPMISDDSDNNEDFNSSRDSKNNVAVNTFRIKELSSNNNIKPSIVANESFKHKRRKTEKGTDNKIFLANNLKENKPKNIEIQAKNLLTCKNGKRVSNKRNLTKTKKNSESLIRDNITSRTRSQKTSQLHPGINGYESTVSPISKINHINKNTSLTCDRKAGGKNSRFLDSSSEEEIKTNVTVRHKKFKRIQVLSNTPSSSDDEILTTTKKKDKTINLLSTSSSDSDGKELNNEMSDKCSDDQLNNSTNNKKTYLLSSNSSNDEDTTTSKTNTNQVQGLNLTQFKPIISKDRPKINRAYSVSISSDGEECDEAQPIHESNIDNNYVPVKETLPPCSSKRSSNELRAPRFIKENSENERIKKSDDHLKNKSQKTKGNIISHSTSNVNTNVWKSIANAQLNRPKSSSAHQSYLKTLKKQFLASNNPSIEINKMINDKFSKNKGHSEPNKESWLKSNVVKEDLSKVKHDCPDLSRPRQHHTDKSLVTNKENNQQIDLNLNMNLQIKCRPNPEQSSTHDESYVTRSSTQMNNETIPKKLDISFSLTGQSNKEFKLSCCDEGTNNVNLNYTGSENMKETITSQHDEQSRSQLKQIEPEKQNNTMASQCSDQSRVQAKHYELEHLKKTPLYQCNDKKKFYPKDGNLKKKKENINVSQDEIKNKTSTITENNVGGFDVLGNILLEMDNNPFRVQKVKKPPEITGSMLGWGSSMPGFHPALQAQVGLPGGLQSSEKENGVLIGKSQIESKLTSSKQANVTVASTLNLNSNNQTSPTVNNFKPNNYVEETKPNESVPITEQGKSLESHNKSVAPVITSFYSVNTEDYNRPKEISKSKSIENGSNLSQNTSGYTSTSQTRVFDCSKTTFDNGKLKSNDLCRENQTNKGQLSLVANSNIPTVNNSIEESENEHCNGIDCGISLASRVCAEKNLKDMVYVQNVIDELTKDISRKKPPESKKVSNNEKKTCSTISNSALGSSTITCSEESTSYRNTDSSNDFTANSTELSKNVVNPIKEPAKGIRIRFGGNVYRVKKKIFDKKETNLTAATDVENQQTDQIPSNTVIANNLSIPSINGTESSSASSSSSSSDSSDESESSESKEEDTIVVSKKSCQSNSLESVPVSDKGKENVVSAESSSSKIVEVDRKVKVTKEILGSTKEDSIDKKTESKTEIIKSASASGENKFLKRPVKSFNLDEMLGLCKKNQVTTNSIIESSGEEIRNTVNTVIISSSSESDTGEDKNDRCKLKNLKKNPVKDNLNSSIHKHENIEDNTNKDVGIVDEIKKISSNDAVQKIGKIRVRSLEELGIVNTCPLPDNALIHPRLELIKANENQNPLAEPLQTDGSNSTSPSTIGPVDKKNKSETLPVTKIKKLINPNTIKKMCELNSSINEPKNLQSDSFNKTTVCVPKINVPFKDNTVVNKKQWEQLVLPQSASSVPNINPNINVLSKTVNEKPRKRLLLPKNASCVQSTGTVNSPELNDKLNEMNSQQFDSFSNQTTASLNTNPFCNPAIPIGSFIALVGVPNIKNNSLESSSVQSSSSQSSSVQPPSAQSSSYDITGKQQTVNEPQTGKDFSNQPVNSTVLCDQSKTESLFFKLCDELFTEVVLLKIPKLVDDLHLVITHDIMREERLKKIDQLKCNYTKEEEKRRTGKEFNEMLKVRGQGFVPLFMTIVRKIEKDNMKTLVLALYIKIIHQLEQIDPNHRSYRFKLRGLIKNMFDKNHVGSYICAIFGEKISSFTSNFNFIEGLLLKYDEFVAKRKNLENASAGNADVETNGSECQTENLVQSNKSEKSSENVKTTNSINNEIINIAPNSEQNRENISTPNTENVPVQLKGGSKTQHLQPVGNLDEMLFGSLNISEMKKKT